MKMNPIWTFARTSSVAVLATCLLAACAQGDTHASDAGDTDTSAQSEPAAKAQKGGGDQALQTTLAPAAPDGTLDLNVETIADGLDQPWCIAFLPNGDMLVTERAGRIRIIRDGELLSEPVSGAPEPYVQAQSGYFDILPHPDFEENNTIYFSYAQGNKNENGLRVISAVFDGESLSDTKVIYDAKPLKSAGLHYGAKLTIGGDNKLYISVGEGSRFKEKAQDMSSSFGAVVRLNLDGSIPDNNPDFGDGALPELYSKGHRNPQGLTYDAERDVLWSNEHGPRGGDEINVIKAGANYGWPIATYGIDYNGALISPFTEYEGTKQPFKYWTPSIGVSGLAVYRGDIFADWDGDLLAGALAGQALHRIDLDNMEIVAEEAYLRDLKLRIRDVRVGPDGAIYVAAQSENAGSVLRLTPETE